MRKFYLQNTAGLNPLSNQGHSISAMARAWDPNSEEPYGLNPLSNQGHSIDGACLF